MVWFQCEDCGDNLKKPKLANHFRHCSAFKLSCIDCGQVFGQKEVESHTQCITEAEKYGPKGPGKASNVTNTTTKSDTKPKPEVDINVGLSERPPWFCSLCNTKATSQQALLLHADGKKHRAKARAFHASKQPPIDTAEIKNASEKNDKDEVAESKDSGDQYLTEVVPPPPLCDGSGVENNASKSNKKRKLDASEIGGVQHKIAGDISKNIDNGEDIRIKETEKDLKKTKYSATQENESADVKELDEKNIKWKKLITSALKSNEDGAMTLKKLKKFMTRSLLVKPRSKIDRNKIYGMIELKINSSSRFILDGKLVRLATNS